MFRTLIVGPTQEQKDELAKKKEQQKQEQNKKSASPCRCKCACNITMDDLKNQLKATEIHIQSMLELQTEKLTNVFCKIILDELVDEDSK